jgi:hypothetical protein
MSFPVVYLHHETLDKHEGGAIHVYKCMSPLTDYQTVWSYRITCIGSHGETYSMNEFCAHMYGSVTEAEAAAMKYARNHATSI